MSSRNSGRLAIHRRSDEIAFLQRRLRTLEAALQDHRERPEPMRPEDRMQMEILQRARDLADILLHTRHTEPLGETLQRRLAMAERICRDLIPPTDSVTDGPDHAPSAYRVAEIERRVLSDMLQHWWGWLQR